MQNRHNDWHEVRSHYRLNSPPQADSQNKTVSATHLAHSQASRQSCALFFWSVFVFKNINPLRKNNNKMKQMSYIKKTFKVFRIITPEDRFFKKIALLSCKSFLSTLMKTCTKKVNPHELLLCYLCKQAVFWNVRCNLHPLLMFRSHILMLPSLGRPQSLRNWEAVCS